MFSRTARVAIWMSSGSLLALLAITAFMHPAHALAQDEGNSGTVSSATSRPTTSQLARQYDQRTTIKDSNDEAMVRGSMGRRDYQAEVDQIAAGLGLSLTTGKFRTKTRYALSVKILHNGVVQHESLLTAFEGRWTIVETAEKVKYRVLISDTDKQDVLLCEIEVEYFYDDANQLHMVGGSGKIAKRSDDKIEIAKSPIAPIRYEVVIRKCNAPETQPTAQSATVR